MMNSFLQSQSYRFASMPSEQRLPVRPERRARSERRSNEGSIAFRDTAYQRIVSIEGVELTDCADVVRDIREAFRTVAEHDMPERLKPYYAMHRMAERMKQHAAREEFSKAAVVRDQLRAFAGSLGITSEEDLASTMARYQKTFGSMPGLAADGIEVCEFTAAILPTDIVTRDGRIRINEKFVRLLFQLELIGAKGEKGNIYKAPGNPSSPLLGNLYTSLLYSIALHTIRGHFPYDREGRMVFRADELVAQGERGERHAYVNLLAMLFYWIMLVEQHEFPKSRIAVFIKKYPHVFRKLSESQRQRLPHHFWKLYNRFAKREGDTSWFELEFTSIDCTREQVDALFQAYPGAVSNETAGG